MTDGPFDYVDSRRMARHQQLLAIWQDLDADELLADLVVLAQLAAFRHRQETLAMAARIDVQLHGAAHDCGEWFKNGRCELCGAQQR